MTNAPPRRGLSFSAILLLALLLLLAGAVAATWALARWDNAARFLGVAADRPVAQLRPQSVGPAAIPLQTPPVAPVPINAADAARIGELESRLARVENVTARADVSAGRADALLIVFAARRAVDRGVALGFLEPLLVERFSTTNPRAVATIVTASRSPVRIDQLAAEFDALEPALKGGGPDEGVWQGLRRELGTLVSIRRADRPSPRPNATYERAKARLAAGQVDRALVEAMRLPGIGRAQPWVQRARTYVAVHRALDEVESSALLAGTR